MDELKKSVATHVQLLINGTNWNFVVPPVGTRVNDATRISDLITQVRIHTPAGPRFFEVIVKESY